MNSGPPPAESPVNISAANARRLQGYFRDGDGPVGIFVHGFRSHCGGDKSVALARRAGERRRPWLRFDLGGHGESDGDFADFRMSRVLADLEAALDWLGERPVVLVGSSLGGWLSTLVALRRPDRVRGLLLIAPAFNFVRNYLAVLPEAERDHWRRTGKRTFEDRYGGAPFTLDYEVITDALAHDVYEWDLDFDCPVALVHGADDEVVPVTASREFAQRARAPWLELTEVPQGDHRLSEAIPLLCEQVDSLWERIGETR